MQGSDNEMVALKTKLEQLEKANANLRERLNIDSNNSSQPPSSDRFKKSKSRSSVKAVLSGRGN